MRTNLPITNSEYPLSDTETIVSTTDLKGKITYANPYFLQVSGFSAEEVIGAPQNIVRHPDMPSEAFADLWSTIQHGQVWTGMVKNRCKNGDFYWVEANVTPIFEDGQTVGYMSVRTKPKREQVQAAEALYKEFKAGNPRQLKMHQGNAIETGLFAKLARLSNLSLQARIYLNVICLLSVLGGLVIVELSDVALYWQLALIFLAVINVLWFWADLQQNLMKPLKQASLACKIMAGGDLTLEIDTKRSDEIGQLLRSMRQMRVNLHSIVRDVRHNFEEIDAATHEIAAGNSNLSNRTESQAAALEETASSMDELAATVQQNSEHAIGANDMARSTSKVAGQGGSIVSNVVHTMDDIGSSSKRIVDIIGIIEGIAFQTNILALNAAVEAARAGDQGRGFAVVASEVRSLAHRSSSAAKEIGQLIGTSVEKINAGVKLAETAGTTMTEIIRSVDDLSSIMNDIALASQQQSSGIVQVNEAITQMDDVTQQNAALVEEAAAAAASLQDQTHRVMQTLNIFKLDQKFIAANKLLLVKPGRPAPARLPLEHSKLVNRAA